MEKPNGHLFLKPAIEHCTAALCRTRMTTMDFILPDRFVACELCDLEEWNWRIWKDSQLARSAGRPTLYIGSWGHRAMPLFMLCAHPTACASASASSCQ